MPVLPERALQEEWREVQRERAGSQLRQRQLQLQGLRGSRRPLGSVRGQEVICVGVWGLGSMWVWVEVKVEIIIISELGMKQSTTPIEAYRLLDRRMSIPSGFSPSPLDLSLVSRKTLEQYQDYLYLKDKLLHYTKKVHKAHKVDDFEVRSYEKLFQLLLDVTGITDKELLAGQLKHIRVWLDDKDRIVKSRTQQGLQRFSVNKNIRNARSLIERLESLNKTKRDLVSSSRIPSDMIKESLQPYLHKWRSLHPDGEAPPVRLNYYDRKNIVLETGTPTRESSGQKYSMINSTVSYALTPVNQSSDGMDEDGKEIHTQIGQEQPSIAADNDLPDEIVLPNDIPMFGDQVDEADESRDAEEADGNLDPRVKLYVQGEREARRDKSRQQATSHRSGSEGQRVEMKMAREIMQMNEDKEMILLSERMAKNKSIVTKEEQKRLEMRILDPLYSLIQEDTPEEFKLPEDLQKKLGLLNLSKPTKRENSLDLSFHLPKLSTARTFLEIEQSISKPKLDILKKRFSNILNLEVEHEAEREGGPPKSMVQYSSRKRAFSSVLQSLSKKTQREIEIQELSELKEKLTSKKVGINAQALAKGLCLPQESILQLDQLPEKTLLHNQFMIEAKKTKKKK